MVKFKTRCFMKWVGFCLGTSFLFWLYSFLSDRWWLYVAGEKKAPIPVDVQIVASLIVGLVCTLLAGVIVRIVKAFRTKN